ncbi:496_t:CDS:2, partial [Gigaspora margarita]
DGVRTSIIQAFLTQMRNIGLLAIFFLSDKDFAQLTLMERLRSNKSSRHFSFNPLSPEGKQFPFDNIMPSSIFCSKELRITVWNLMEKHLHQHPYIPTTNSQFFTAIEIYELAIKESYEFYGLFGKISILKTTIFIEHWQVIKRDFLYKFFRPRLDLLVFILTTKVIVLQKRKFQQIQIGVQKLDWRKQLKSEWKKLQTHKINAEYFTNVNYWICGCTYYLLNRFPICKHLIQQKGEVSQDFFDKMQRNHQPPFLYENEQI